MDYNTTDTPQGINFAPDGRQLYRWCLEIASGPNNSEDAYSHNFLNLQAIEVRGAMYRDGAHQTTIPYTPSPNDTQSKGAISIWWDTANIYISSADDWSSWEGFIIVDYLN